MNVIWRPSGRTRAAGFRWESPLSETRTSPSLSDRCRSHTVMLRNIPASMSVWRSSVRSCCQILMDGPASKTRARSSQRRLPGRRTGSQLRCRGSWSAMRSAVASSSTAYRCESGTRRPSGRRARCNASRWPSAGAAGACNGVARAPATWSPTGRCSGTVRRGRRGGVGSPGVADGSATRLVSSLVESAANPPSELPAASGGNTGAPTCSASQSTSASSRGLGVAPTADNAAYSRSARMSLGRLRGQVGHQVGGQRPRVRGAGDLGQVDGIEKLIGGELASTAPDQKLIDNVRSVVRHVW